MLHKKKILKNKRLLKIQKIQHFPSSTFQQQILPKMVSSSTDLHHKVADINDINFAGMVTVHTRRPPYCLHLVCICKSQAPKDDLAKDIGLQFLILILKILYQCGQRQGPRGGPHTRKSLEKQVGEEKACVSRRSVHPLARIFTD